MLLWSFESWPHIWAFHLYDHLGSKCERKTDGLSCALSFRVLGVFLKWTESMCRCKWERERVSQSDRGEETAQRDEMFVSWLANYASPRKKTKNFPLLSFQRPALPKTVPGQMSFHTLGNLRLISTFFLFQLWKTRLSFHTVLISPSRTFHKGPFKIQRGIKRLHTYELQCIQSFPRV